MVPWANRRGRAAAAARSPNVASGVLWNFPPTPRSKSTAAGTMGTTWWGSGSDLEATVAIGEPAHHPVGGGEAVGAAPGEAHGVDRFDEVDRVEQIGLARAGGAASEVDAADRARWRQHHRRAGEPSPSAPLEVADVDACDVGEVVVWPDHCVPGHAGRLALPRWRSLARTVAVHASPSRKRRAASTYTLACSTMSATSTYSSA